MHPQRCSTSGPSRLSQWFNISAAFSYWPLQYNMEAYFSLPDIRSHSKESWYTLMISCVTGRLETIQLEALMLANVPYTNGNNGSAASCWSSDPCVCRSRRFKKVLVTYASAACTFKVVTCVFINCMKWYIEACIGSKILTRAWNWCFCLVL